MNEVMCRTIWLEVDQDCIPPHTGAVSLGISSLLVRFSILAFIIIIYLFYPPLPQMPSPSLHEPSSLPIEFIGRRLLANILRCTTLAFVMVLNGRVRWLGIYDQATDVFQLKIHSTEMHLCCKGKLIKLDYSKLVLSNQDSATFDSSHVTNKWKPS